MMGVDGSRDGGRLCPSCRCASWAVLLLLLIFSVALLNGCGSAPAGNSNGDGATNNDGTGDDGTGDGTGDGTDDGTGDDDTTIGGGEMTITGAVVDGADTSLAVTDAYVYIPVASAAGMAQTRRNVYAAGQTGSDGTFRLEGVPVDNQRIVVEPPTGSGYSAIEISLDLRGHGSAEIDIQITLIPSDTEEIASVTVDPSQIILEPGAQETFRATVVGASG